jgi:hypothetical protein
MSIENPYIHWFGLPGKRRQLIFYSSGNDMCIDQPVPNSLRAQAQYMWSYAKDWQQIENALLADCVETFN